MKVALLIFWILDLLLAFFALGFFIFTGEVFFAVETGIVIFLLFVVAFVAYNNYRSKE